MDENKPENLTLSGNQRVHSWYAWAIVIIVFAMGLALVYITNHPAN